MTRADHLGDELKQWMIERFGPPLYSDMAWFDVNGVRHLHTVLMYPHVDSDEDWHHDGRWFQSRGRVSRAYVRLSFIDGPTKADLEALPSYKPEGQLAKELP